MRLKGARILTFMATSTSPGEYSEAVHSSDMSLSIQGMGELQNEK